MELGRWVDRRGGIVHRGAAAGAGFGIRVQRREVAAGAVRRIRRSWLATNAAPADLETAAANGGRLACVSVARRRSWWMPEEDDAVVHLRVDPHGASPSAGVLAHWSVPLTPAHPHSLIESVEDALAHIASCLPREQARAVWESAIRIERLSPDALRRIRWPSLAARDCADEASGLSDSGLETIAVVRLSQWGLPIRQQIMIAGHRVDLLIGKRLILQIDGFAYHSDAAQRSRDVAADGELMLRGYTVLRVTYSQVIHDWPSVERIIARAITAGAHCAR